MSEKKLYKDYFNIDPKYYAAVTADLIQEGKVDWKSFYPHETFVKLLERTHSVLSGKDPRSLWIEGAYGTGKSHAALTVKSLLEASDEEVEAYFQDYGLQQDLCQKLITDKNSGKLITIHRIGSADIHSDSDLVVAVQQSIMQALKEHGIENQGDASMKEAFLQWLQKPGAKDYFNAQISQEKYAWNFGGMQADEIVEQLNHGSEQQIESLMRNIMIVLKEAGQNIYCDINGLANWIKNIIAKNHISAILFIWDEFTEYFINNPNTLTGFQTLVEISLSHPFYFMIVSHESRALFKDADTAKKILDRFVPPVKIELPENMAFRLMAQAMKKTSDPVLAKEWEQCFKSLNEDLASVRNTIVTNAKKNSTMGNKTVISDAELQSIVPIHPYAALMLKHLSVAFSSNQRSMFDFIISNDMTDAKGFKWFINNFGPLDNTNLLTIDMLWDFFYGKGHNGLNDDVRVILDSYGLLQTDKLTPDEQRVFKTVLLLQAISLRVSDVELLRPNEQNVDLAFSGTSWAKGKGRSIAEKLCQAGLLFKRQVGGGKMEYTVANSTGDTATIEKHKQAVRNETKTQDLVVNADLMGAIQLPAAIRNRFVMESATVSNFMSVTNKLNSCSYPEKFKVVVTFALNDDEAVRMKAMILKVMESDQYDLMFLDASLTPMGADLYEQYVENMAYSRYYAHNDKTRATGFENQARRCLREWNSKVASGAFMLYDSDHKSGVRHATLNALHDALRTINHQVYYYGLEQYNLSDTMFTAYQLAKGAEYGLKQETGGAYRNSNKDKSLETALAGAWKIERYWEDQSKQSLPIVRIKQEVIRVIREGFEKGAGRVSISSIYEALEKKPFGFLPCSVTAFVMGFVLKEYANSNYFWSNGSASETMTIDKMKVMIANVIHQKITYKRNYKEEYIVSMSPELRAFLDCTAKVFRIPSAQCGSIESARDQIRIKMKHLPFPIWCVKYILDKQPLTSNADVLKQIIDAYCGIANTANSGTGTESDLAEKIGRLVHNTPAIVPDLEHLLVDEYCIAGMKVYISHFQGGVLQKLAVEIGDNGAYLDQVKQKFSADAANWVWNTATADEKIADVILEYRIIAESNKSLSICKSLHDVVVEWNKRSNNIRIPYEIVSKVVGDLGPFLKQLYYLKQSGMLQEQNKQKFYDLLVSQREAFEHFYKEQTTYFKQIAASFLDDLDDSDIEKLYADFPAGQFTKSSSEYYRFVENSVKQFVNQQAKKKLKDLWMEKTHTKDPVDWSAIYNTPILCMFDDAERSTAKKMFSIMLQSSPDENEVNQVIQYLKNADFFDRLNDPAERDRCFMERVVGEFAVMIPDADTARQELTRSNISDKPYDWMDNQAVRNQLKKAADKRYKISGRDRALSIIEQMDPAELRHYLRELISDNLMIGMEILRNQ
jgi:hypothetical protein